MSIHSVIFISEATAVRMQPLPAAAIISISNPGKFISLQEGWDQILSVNVADASYDEKTIESYGRMWFLSSRGFPTKAHALAIRRFLDTLPAHIETLVIHCGAGVSRSGAVAKYAAARFGTHFPTDYNRYNEALYRLLENPEVFDSSLARINADKPSFLHKMSTAIRSLISV